LAPDPTQAEAFIRSWFKDCTAGSLEIGWMDPEGRGLIHFERFERADLPALLARATQENLVPGQSMYIRAATVRGPAGNGRPTTDADVAQAPGLWADYDDVASYERAAAVASPLQPTLEVVTGEVPHRRVQRWYQISEPEVAPERIRAANVALHAMFGGDPTIVNPSRYMRLPGMIAWPWKAGRVPELVRLTDLRGRTWSTHTLMSYLPGLREPTAASSAPASNGSAPPPGAGPAGALSVFSQLNHEIRTAPGGWHNAVVRCVAHLVGTGWSDDQVMALCEGWTRAGYKHDDTRREVWKALEGARRKGWTPDGGPLGDARPEPWEIPAGTTTPDRPAILSLAELDALPPPRWLIEGLFPEASLIVPYGPPKAGKTFIVLSAALHIAADRSWFGHPVQTGAVVYVAGEGVGGLAARVRAMRAHHDIPVDTPFFVIPRAVNLRDGTAVSALEKIIREKIGDSSLRLIVFDTLARSMPGGDENSAKDVGAVVAAADWLRDRFGCSVALVHHMGKDEGKGARGSTALQGAWDAAFEITSRAGRVVLRVVDQKDAEGGQSLAFEMREVMVGLGRSSLVPVLDEAAIPDARQPDPGGFAGIMLRILRNLVASPAAAILPPFEGYPSGDIQGARAEDWKRAVYETMPDITPGNRQRAFHRGRITLLDARLINIKDPWVWLC
jgi:hypothetical protein